MKRLNREIRHRTRVVDSFPDGNSALLLVCARLRHVVGAPSGAQVHEYEAPRGRHGGRPHCQLTSFTPDSSNLFAKNP